MVVDQYYEHGSNGLLFNGKVLFIIETKKVSDFSNWLFKSASKFGISRSDCTIIGNNPEPSKHHLCHAVGAYYQSGFNDASILVIDGMNEPNGISIGIYSASGDDIKEVRTYSTRHSLGTFYANGTDMCGLGDYRHAGKLMGAASYSNTVKKCKPFLTVDRYTGDIDDNQTEYITFDDLILREEYLNTIFDSHLGPDTKFDFRAVESAATVQKLFEDSVFSLLEYMWNTLPSKNLILSGGCALNCTCNGKIIRSKKWDNLFIPNMCEDQGNIIGRIVMEYGQKVNNLYMYNNVSYPVPSEYNYELDPEELSKLIKSGKIIAWFEGGSEYGPRALCHRSLLADPFQYKSAYRLNEVKNREYWRPLAPVVLDTHFSKYFDVDGRIWPIHKTMLSTEYIREEYRLQLRNVMAPDGTSRPQVLTDNRYNSILYSIMKDYDLPILINTSMNGKDEPICETPEDAIKFANRNSDVVLVFVHKNKLYIREKVKC